MAKNCFSVAVFTRCQNETYIAIFYHQALRHDDDTSHEKCTSSCKNKEIYKYFRKLFQRQIKNVYSFEIIVDSCLYLWLGLTARSPSLKSWVIVYRPFSVITNDRDLLLQVGLSELLCSETMFINVWSKRNTFSTLLEWKVSQLNCKWKNIF